MLSKRAVVGWGLETTYGVEAAISQYVLASDVDVKPEGDVVERGVQIASLSKLPHLIGAKWQSVSFKVRVKGDGSEIDGLLQACLMAKTDTGTSYDYQPATSGGKSVTLAIWKDGIKHVLTGAVGNPEVLTEAGQPGVLSFTFQGLWNAPVDAALPSATYVSQEPPICQSANLTIGGDSVIAQQVQIALNNNIAPRRSLNAANALAGFIITSRAPSGSFNPEVVTLATKNFINEWQAGTDAALSITIGSATGNKCIITAPKVRYESIAYGEREEILIYDIPFRLYMNSGDDELKLSFPYA